jgi:ABC-type multidrug transport system permease subunit
VRKINRDARNLDLLAIFHFILAGLNLLLATLLIVPIIIAAAILQGRLDLEWFCGPLPPIPELVGWLVLVIFSLLVVLGWVLGILMIFCGLYLQKRSHYNFCFVVSALECLLVPYGTILGAVTIIFLLKNSVKEIFDAG